MTDQVPTILVVDDSEMNRDLLYRLLKRHEYKVASAENGREGLETLRADPDLYDLILLDVMMPEMTGHEMLEHLKDDEELNHIPVIVISALDTLDSVVKCIELGAADYMTKPINRVLLDARVDATLEKKALRDQEAAHLHQIEHQKERSDALLKVVIPIGVALSSEKDFNHLLEVIVEKAMELCNADGGTLYLRTNDDLLSFVIMRNNSLEIMHGGSQASQVPYAPLRLYDEASKEPNHKNIASHAVLSGDTINIPDAYTAEGFDFTGTKAFDGMTGYRSTSFLTIPLKNNENRVVGILQLINAQNSDNVVIPFSQYTQELMEALAALATAALEAYEREANLRIQIADLQIELDDTRKAKQVANITDTEYFVELQGRAKGLRRRSKGVKE